MFHSIKDFQLAWKQESANTAKLYRALTDQSLAQEVAPGHRTLGRIAWHILTTYPEMMGQTGLEVGSVKADAPVPSTAQEIVDAYEKTAKELLDQVTSKWTDESLALEDEMYGMKWPKGLTLSILINHEVHHRGQMTVLMRQAGLKVPGVYGPSYDEWDQFGQKPPEV